MERIKIEIKRYRWLIVAGLTVSLFAGIIMANIHVVDIVLYKVQGDTSKIATLLEENVSNEEARGKWYFTEGAEYLIDHLDEHGRAFFEAHFNELTEEMQSEVITAYNKKQVLFNDTNTVMGAVINHLDQLCYQSYLNRIKPEVLDEALANYYGEITEINEEFIKRIYQIVTIYPQKLVFDKFQFNLYALMILEDTSIENLEEMKNAIFNKVDSEKAREMILSNLRQTAVDGDELKRIMDFLNQNQILEGKEYTSFNNIYSEVYIIRKQYSSLDEREVELTNKKEAVDLQIKDQEAVLEQKSDEVVSLQSEISNIESELNTLTNSTFMALYIEKPYGNGDYEASIPRKNLWGNYKPSSQKFIVKLTSSDFSTEGVYYLDIYTQGTKLSSDGKEYPYYVEVSKSELSQIESLQSSRTAKLNSLSALQAEMDTLSASIKEIKDKAGYEETINQIKELTLERESLEKRIKEKENAIKTLLGIGNLTIKMTANA